MNKKFELFTKKNCFEENISNILKHSINIVNASLKLCFIEFFFILAFNYSSLRDVIVCHLKLPVWLGDSHILKLPART